MKTLFVWLLLCGCVFADDVVLNNVPLLVRYSESGYPVEASVFRAHGSGNNIITSGDYWVVGFKDEKIRKTFFDIINNYNNNNEKYSDERSKVPLRINVDIIAEEYLSLYGKNINIKSLQLTLKNK